MTHRTSHTCGLSARLTLLRAPLLLLLLLLTVVALSGTAAAVCTGRERNILVVGAGVSGAAAAYNITLSNPCFKVTILEARGRVGGRMYSRTEPMPGSPSIMLRAEMGAQWIQTFKGGNPITALANKYGVTYALQNGEESQYTAGGYKYSDKEQSGNETRYQALFANAERIANRKNADISLDAAFRMADPVLYQTPFVQARASQDFEFEYGGLNDLSAWYYEEEGGFTGGDALALNGYDTIPKRLVNDSLAAGAKLVLNFAVTAVTATRTSVTVRGVLGGSGPNGTTGGTPQTYTADAVIVTLPLGVLKTGRVAFSPPLSGAKLGAITRLGVSNVNKVVFFYNQAFWATQVDEYVIEDPVLPANRGRFVDWINLKRAYGYNGLLGVAVGDYAARMPGMAEADIIADARAKVNAMFKPASQPANAPIVTWVQRWNADPFTLGSYSYAKVGSKGNADFNTLSQPEGRILFAGEHTNSVHRSSVHGAYLTGLREARRVLTTY